MNSENINLIERNAAFDLAFRFVTETNENVFLTGKAGTGKTTFLKYLRAHSPKNMIVAAPTGVAAINAGGVTLHSLFQLPFHPFLPTRAQKDQLLSQVRIVKQRQQLLQKMELLVIDEISMVRCDTLDAIDTILRSVRRRHAEPFGGVQLLFIGDLYQLPPVAQRHEWSILESYYASPFFFDSMVIKEQMPLLIELDTIYRQKEDSFVNLLNKVRNNQMEADDFEDLNMRYVPGFRPALEEKYITLTSHNNQADVINNRELQSLISVTHTYEAEIDGDFPPNSYPADGTLILKEGAQVMFLKNDGVQKRYFNGKIGVIKKLLQDEILVECDEADIWLSRETWQNARYTLNRADGKLEQEVMGTFTQFPLRLAWAITIHKSQGLTFDKVMIDAERSFTSGQVYVALSRCTSLEGMVLLTKIPPVAIYSNENVVKGQQTLAPKGSLAERFVGARQVFTQQILDEIFGFHTLERAVTDLQKAVETHAQKLNSDAINWTAGMNAFVAQCRNTGSKFIAQTEALMRTEPVIEQNEPLQNRIKAACNHFIPLLNELETNIRRHPLVTEHRDAANAVNASLQNLLLAAITNNYLMEYGREDFSVTAYLQHKLGFAVPRMSLSCYASKTRVAETNVPNPELFETLKRWRDMTCEETGLPIYMVANHASLLEIATYLPFTKKDLVKISGFGMARTEKYGDIILETVEDYCSRMGLESNMAEMKTVEPKKRKEKSPGEKNPTQTISFNLFKEGRSIAEIAKERNLTFGTIEGHLASFLATGDIKLDELVSTEKQLLITNAIKTYGKESTKTLKDNLPENVSYGEIRLVISDENKTGEK